MTSIRQRLRRIRTIPGLVRSVISVMVLATLGIGSAGYIVSQYGWTSPWQDRYTFVAEFDKGKGVDPESRQEVRIAGVTVGEIETAQPAPGGRARVTMSLEPGHTVYDNARAVLRTKTPVNIMYVALDPGGPPANPLPEGGTIPVSQTEAPVAPSDILNKLDERTQDALTSLINASDAALAQAPQHLPGGIRATDAVLNKLQPVAERLKTRREKIAQLITSLSRISTAVGKNDERLTRLISSLQTTLTVLGKRDGELGKTLQQLPGLSDDLHRAMTATSSLTNQLDPTLHALNQASGNLSAALSQLTPTVTSAGHLINVAKPVVNKAKPVMADLLPLAQDVNQALGDLAPITKHLPSATKRIVPWMNDLAAFVYQTSSVFSLHDANGGWGRANVQVVLPTEAMVNRNKTEGGK